MEKSDLWPMLRTLQELIRLKERRSKKKERLISSLSLRAKNRRRYSSNFNTGVSAGNNTYMRGTDECIVDSKPTSQWSLWTDENDYTEHSAI